MKYPFVIYTSWGLKDFGDGTYQAACARGPLILVRPEKRDDAGLVAHELVHVAQWAIGLFLGLLLTFLAASQGCPQWPYIAGASIGLHSLAYLTIPAYREWAEVAAYRRQLQCYPDDRRDLFAGFISAHYGLSITKAEAFNKMS